MEVGGTHWNPHEHDAEALRTAHEPHSASEPFSRWPKRALLVLILLFIAVGSDDDAALRSRRLGEAGVEGCHSSGTSSCISGSSSSSSAAGDDGSSSSSAAGDDGRGGADDGERSWRSSGTSGCTSYKSSYSYNVSKTTGVHGCSGGPGLAGCGASGVSGCDSPGVAGCTSPGLTGCDSPGLMGCYAPGLTGCSYGTGAVGCYSSEAELESNILFLSLMPVYIIFVAFVPLLLPYIVAQALVIAMVTAVLAFCYAVVAGSMLFALAALLAAAAGALSWRGSRPPVAHRRLEAVLAPLSEDSEEEEPSGCVSASDKVFVRVLVAFSAIFGVLWLFTQQAATMDT